MKILLVKACAESHVYSQFVNSLQGALTELGHESAITDQSIYVANDMVNPAHLARELQATRFDAVVSFNALFGATLLANGTSFFDAMGLKFLGWQLDHPILAPQSRTRQLQNRYAIYSSPDHLKFARAIKVPGQGISMLPGAEPLQSPAKPYRSRPWSIFVAATWNGQPEPIWENSDVSPARRLLTGVVERLLADETASLLDAFNNTSDDLKLGAKFGVDPAFDDQIVDLLRLPFNYFRHLDRINIIQSLADSGLPLTICGPGWRDFLGDRGNVVYLDHRVDFKDLSALYGDAKVAINLNAGNGGCERAIHSAMAGAAILSDYSQQLAWMFQSPDERAFFNRAKIGDVAEVAGRLIESDQGETMAQLGHQRILEAGLWRHRAARMVEFLSAA